MRCVVCNVCDSPVSERRSPRWRLARADGGYDHAHCSLGLNSFEFQELDRSKKRVSQRGPTEGSEWVRVASSPGGWAAWCRLCGKRTRRFFKVADTNHAEAYRLATAYEAGHRMSRMHALALGAFRADVHLSTDDKLLRAIFPDHVPPSEHEMRRRAASTAAVLFGRRGGSTTD